MMSGLSVIMLCCLLIEVAKVEDTHYSAIHTEKGVITSQIPHHHVGKREINNKKVAGFSDEEKKAILKLHNTLRAKEGSSNMKRMTWSDDLELLAQKYAENCVFDHSTKEYRRNVGGFTYIGENLYAGTGAFEATSPIQMWWDETKFYTYNTKYCQPGQMCGHYTQVVWADSYALGCGVKYCPVLRSVDFGQGYNVVCHYGPGGNYQGESPYKKGEACSKCDKDELYCINSLCAMRPQIGWASSSTSIHGSLSRIMPIVLIIYCSFITQFYNPVL